jgi:hypothetical protein
MNTIECEVDSQSHIDDLVDRLYETYNRVEIIKTVKHAITVLVVLAVGY